MKKVLIVEDSRYMQELIRSQLPADYEVIGTSDNEAETLALAAKHKPDLITMDNILPDAFGADITVALRKAGVQSKILVISSLSSDAMVRKQMESGANAYLPKPFTEEELQKAVKKIFS